MTKSLVTLTRSLGYRFDDLKLLQRALTHRSAGSRNNERLEFLGDAVLGAVIAAELYARNPGASEGELSRMRASLVRRESLSGLARALGLGDYLALGSGERKSGGYRRNSILADSLEAVFGAVYLDGGFEAVRQFILALFTEKLAETPDPDRLKDAKTRLQEYLQSRQLPLPRYTVLEISGDAHAQSFRVQCMLSDIEVAPTEGEARSRRHAEQQAADRMLAQVLDE